MSNFTLTSRKSATVLTSLTVLGAIAVVSAQPRIQVPRIPGQVLANQRVPLLQAKITPELRNYLVANKPKVSTATIDRSFVLQNGVPAFKLDDGTTRLLMPNAEASGDGAAAAVPEELAAAKPYISAPLKLGAVRSQVFKLNPNYQIALGVDRRNKMSPIRDQGGRGTCVAYASNAALEPFLPIPDDLSEQYTYHKCLEHDGQPFNFNKGTYTQTVINIMQQGTVTENAWPYTYNIPPANEAVPAAATSAPKYKITSTQFIANNGLTGASIRNPNYLEAILDKGYNIFYTTQVAWYGNHNNDVIDVVIDAATGQPAASRGNHAMLIVGYSATGNYFIVRNSWGTGFGHDGYAYISHDYIRTYANDGFYIKGISPNSLVFQGPVINEKIKLIPKNRIQIPR